MYSSSVLVLALAVFGASAQTLISSGSGLNGGLINGGLVGGVNSGLVGGINSGLVGVNSGLVGGINSGLVGVNTGLVGGINSGLVGGVNSGLVGVNTGLVGGVTGINNGLVGVSGVNTGITASTPVFENVPLRLPSFIHPTSVQDSCNCMKTIVRPQLRKEVYTIPSVQRFVQTTSTPVVETVPYVTGSAADVPAVTGVESGIIGGVSGLGVSGVVNTGFNGLSGLVSGINTC